MYELKKVFTQMSIALLAVGVLSACGSTEDSSGSEKNVKENQSTTEKTSTASQNKSEENKSESKEVKNGPLTEVGQWTKEDNGTKVTLVKIINPKKVINLDPIKFKIETIKLLERTNITDDEKESIKTLFNKDITDKLNTIQISYTTENKSDKDVSFFTIDKITTNTKQQIDGSLNLADNSDPQQYMGKVISDGTLLFPYFADSFDAVTELNVLTSNVFSTDTGSDVHTPVKVKFEF